MNKKQVLEHQEPKAPAQERDPASRFAVCGGCGAITVEDGTRPGIAVSRCCPPIVLQRDLTQDQAQAAAARVRG